MTSCPPSFFLSSSESSGLVLDKVFFSLSFFLSRILGWLDYREFFFLGSYSVDMASGFSFSFFPLLVYGRMVSGYLFFFVFFLFL